MPAKTDLQSINLTAAERAAAQAKAVNADLLLAAAKQGATDLANQIGEVLKVLPAGANKTALASIQTSLL